jgi:hypothetical protein
MARTVLEITTINAEIAKITSAISAFDRASQRPPTVTVTPVRTLIGSAGNPNAGS